MAAKEDAGSAEAASAPRQAQAARERRADDRDRQADDREALANEREHLADEREREADRREVAVAEREHLAGVQERAPDERAQGLGQAAATSKPSTREAIKRSRALLAQSGQLLDRWEAALGRAEAHGERQQAEVDRASAEGERGLADQPPDPKRFIERARVLHGQAVTALEGFAAAEEEVADTYVQLAASDAARRAEYGRIAEQARASARRVREAVRTVRNARSRPERDAR